MSVMFVCMIHPSESGYPITPTIKPTVESTVIVHRAYLAIICVRAAMTMLSIPSTSSRFMVPGPRWV